MNMNILIAVASRHGSTREIAEAIGDEMRELGHTVQVRDVEAADPGAGYDAILVGSAVYVGNWLGEARSFVERHQDTLTSIPVWLFSSGPLGDPPHPPGDPQGIEELMAQTGARGHQTFVGSLDKDQLGMKEKLIVRMVKAPDGDFRDWEAIRGWAREVVSALAPVG